MESFVGVQPPHSRPCENDVSAAGLAHAFHFADGLAVVRRMAPVLAFIFEKRQADALAIRRQPRLLLVDKYIPSACRDGVADFG